MNHLRVRLGAAFVTAAAVVVTTGPLAPPTVGATAAGPKWKTERGIVVECTGHVGTGAGGTDVWTSVYENSRYGNTVQVVLGDPDEGHGKNKEQDAKFLQDGVLTASLKVEGTPVAIGGTAERRGKRIKVYESIDDAGMRVVTKGFHRRLRTDLVVTVDGVSAPLTCKPAFYYDLQVKRIPIV